MKANKLADQLLTQNTGEEKKKQKQSYSFVGCCRTFEKVWTGNKGMKAKIKKMATKKGATVYKTYTPACTQLL